MFYHLSLFITLILAASLAKTVKAASLDEGLYHLSSGTTLSWQQSLVLPAHEVLVPISKSCFLLRPEIHEQDELVSGTMTVNTVRLFAGSSQASRLLSEQRSEEYNHGRIARLPESFSASDEGVVLALKSGAYIYCNPSLKSIREFKLEIQKYLTLYEPAPVPGHF